MKTTKTLIQDGRPPGRDVNPRPPKYEVSINAPVECKLLFKYPGTCECNIELHFHKVVSPMSVFNYSNCTVSVSP
jgi:hypothetical protein